MATAVLTTDYGNLKTDMLFELDTSKGHGFVMEDLKAFCTRAVIHNGVWYNTAGPYALQVVCHDMPATLYWLVVDNPLNPTQAVMNPRLNGIPPKGWNFILPSYVVCGYLLKWWDANRADLMDVPGGMRVDEAAAYASANPDWTGLFVAMFRREDECRVGVGNMVSITYYRVEFPTGDVLFLTEDGPSLEEPRGIYALREFDEDHGEESHPEVLRMMTPVGRKC